MKGHPRMFKSVEATVNWVPGCTHGCTYCYARPLASRFDCELCKTFEPHEHFERETPPSPEGSLVMANSLGDLFCEGNPPQRIYKVMAKIAEDPKRDYLVCTKNPERVLAFLLHIPPNGMIGTTLETNRDEVAGKYSKAPSITQRVKAMDRLITLAPKIRTFVSVEPVMDFNLIEFYMCILLCKPWIVEIGYDNHFHHLEEPPREKVLNLKSLLRGEGIVVHMKSIRERWNG